MDDYSSKILGSTPHETSPYGVMDISGKVWEWVNDWYQADYYQSSPSRNPLGPETGTQKVVRGGSWYSQLETFRSAARKSMIPFVDGEDLGFRCVINNYKNF
jgi:formylglycine-generating enzyme required for sulfatase activity